MRVPWFWKLSPCFAWTLESMPIKHPWWCGCNRDCKAPRGWPLDIYASLSVHSKTWKKNMNLEEIVRLKLRILELWRQTHKFNSMPLFCELRFEDPKTSYFIMEALNWCQLSTQNVCWSCALNEHLIMAWNLKLSNFSS
jgi:hypothetical protein